MPGAYFVHHARHRCCESSLVVNPISDSGLSCPNLGEFFDGLSGKSTLSWILNNSAILQGSLLPKHDFNGQARPGAYFTGLVTKPAKVLYQLKMSIFFLFVRSGLDTTLINFLFFAGFHHNVIAIFCLRFTKQNPVMKSKSSHRLLL